MRRNAMVLIILPPIIGKYSSSDNLLSSIRFKWICFVLWKTFVLLNLSEGWRILWFSCQGNFLSLLIWITIKTHLLLKSPFIYSFFTSLFIWLAELWKLWATENREVSSAKILTLKKRYQVNQLCKSRITMEVVLNLKELLYSPHSKKMFARLELLFVSYFSRNSGKLR